MDEVAAVTFDRREVPPVFLRLCQNCFAHITSMVEWLEFKALEAPSPIDRWEDAGDCAVVQRRSGATTFGTARPIRGHDTRD